MTARVLSAVVGIPLALLTIYLGGWWFTSALAVLVYFGGREFFSLVERKGYQPAQELCLTFSLGLLGIQQALPEFATSAFVLAGALVCVSLLFRKEPATIADISTSLLGLFYAGFLPSFLIRLRALDQGVSFLLLTFACIWAADIGAFFFGKAFGKTRPWQQISPKKTVEGALFGTAASLLVGTLGAYWMQWNLWPLTGIVFGLLIGISGLLGDLTESLMKRDAQVKNSGDLINSGGLIPGHGGVLDRADSYIFTAPVAFYFVSFFVLERLFLR